MFLVSWVLHILLTYHRSDYSKLPDEDAIMKAMRDAGVRPGNYFTPWGDGPKAMASPEWQEKCRQGPCALINVRPSEVPNMGKSLAAWFVFILVVSVFVAYLTGRTNGAGVAGCSAFMAYGLGEVMNTVWKAQKASTTAKHVLDGLVFALVTAGTFGWLWP